LYNLLLEKVGESEKFLAGGVMIAGVPSPAHLHSGGCFVT
jgi:hypothetical protein